MSKTTEHYGRCPTCGRKFKSIREYPRVLILSFEQLPVPEAVDSSSDEASEKRRARRKAETEITDFREEAINRTPEIARLCARGDVKEYLERLSRLAGQIVAPGDLRPHFEPSTTFKWAHPVPKTKLFLSVTEEERENVSKGIAVIEVYCKGPNMGSAGGPTLLHLGPIARIHYQGLLL